MVDLITFKFPSTLGTRFLGRTCRDIYLIQALSKQSSSPTARMVLPFPTTILYSFFSGSHGVANKSQCDRCGLEARVNQRSPEKRKKKAIQLGPEEEART